MENFCYKFVENKRPVLSQQLSTFFLTFTAVMAESSYHKISCENESNAKKTFLTRLINSLEVFTQENLKVDRKIVVLKNSFCSCKVRVMSQVATELWQ